MFIWEWLAIAFGWLLFLCLALLITGMVIGVIIKAMDVIKDRK